MWTNENRARYDRRGLRYPSDLTDEEWMLITKPSVARQLWHAPGVATWS